MRKSDIMQYFDDRAHDWDANMIKDDAVINRILDNAEIGAGVHVLDVACGTGVLIPYLLERGVASVTAIDISSEMVKLAREKFSEDSVNILWGGWRKQTSADALTASSFTMPSRIFRILLR